MNKKAIKKIFYNDNLYKFKLKISDIIFDYNIYKNILNEKVYNNISKGSNNNLNDYFPLHLKN